MNKNSILVKIIPVKSFLAIKKFHKLIASLLLAFCTASSFADEAPVIEMNNMPPPAVSIRYPQEKTDVGTQITVQVTIPPKWHINANVAADEFLKPSTLSISAKGITFGEPVWPAPIKEYSEALDLDNLVFKGTFQLQIPVKSVEAGYDTSTTNVDFGYQACSNFICLAPHNVHAALGIKTLQTQPDDGISKKKSIDFLAVLLFFAFLGGAILNLMPCVLPVLFLKLFSLVRNARETRKRLFALTGALTLGILASFWALALLVSVIKVGGGNAGWGFQFQNPGFIAFMVAVLAAFAMNLFGFFELFLPGQAATKMDAMTKKEGLAGAFFSGVLMVLLSTPCSAPFLGSAMGFAFTQNTPTLFLFFTAAGLGLAMPYILTALFPQILRVFPKPGPWMVKFQKFLGLFLLGTAVWLVWVSFGMMGTRGAIVIGGFGILALILSFFFGKIARPDKPFYRELLTLGITILLLFLSWTFAARPQIDSAIEIKAKATASEAMDEEGWYRYTPKVLKALQLEDRPIFIDVTADWCLTCKTNEAVILSRDTVQSLFKHYNVLKVKADFTFESAEVSELLKELGRSGVPAYAVYHPETRTTETLSEILSLDAISETLQKE